MNRRTATVVIGALAAAALAVAIVAGPLGGGPSASPSTTPTATAPSTSTSPSSPASAAPSADTSPGGGAARIGDYRCLTLAVASVRIENDGFVVGEINYTFEGGASDDTWLVERQEPEPSAPADPGAPVSLTLSSPFFVCPSGSPSTGP